MHLAGCLNSKIYEDTECCILAADTLPTFNDIHSTVYVGLLLSQSEPHTPPLLRLGCISCGRTASRSMADENRTEASVFRRRRGLSTCLFAAYTMTFWRSIVKVATAAHTQMSIHYTAEKYHMATFIYFDSQGLSSPPSPLCSVFTLTFLK